MKNELFCIKDIYLNTNITIENPATGELEELDMDCHCGYDCTCECGVH